MTQRKICGFDVNGWRDLVARNWKVRPGEDEEIGPVVFGQSGPLSSVVRVGDDRNIRWVGGRQADLAPHGRGDGWGDVGRAERRVTVRALLSGREGDPVQLAAAYAGLARGAAHNVAAIDDTPEVSEALQERILAGLDAAKIRNPMLVWRPVLAVLHAVETGLLANEQVVGVVCHAPNGLTVQKLRLRQASGRNGTLMAPERRQAATLVRGDVGYETLVKRARDVCVGQDGFTPRTAHRAQARSVGRLALGFAPEPEILREANGGWDEMKLPKTGFLPDRLVKGSLPSMDDCGVVLVETLAEGKARRAIVEWTSRATSRQALALPAKAVAHGALVAARRLGDGDPVYFDFLPRLSTIVFGQDGADNFDLIDETETLEAGRIYRSPQPASLKIPAGHSSVSIWLQKEAEPHPRKATVDLDVPLKEPSPVSLWVEQKPAAGRARIVLEAPDLGRQFSIDWEKAEDDERAWEDIIQSLKTPPPSVPSRLVLKCGLRPWEDSDRAEGLSNLLLSEPHWHWVDWDTLAGKMASRPFGEYCISSDGDLPGEVGVEDRERLDLFTERALDATRERLHAKRADWDGNNAALKFLTWQFRRCPQKVAEWLLKCVAARHDPTFDHPFIRHPMSWILIYQGLARIVRDQGMEQRVLEVLLSSRVEKWNWRMESACVAILLSRSDTAPMFLERGDVERLVARTIADFEENIDTEYTKFNYAPFLMAGLLRWRLKEPRGLLLGNDPLATGLASSIRRAERDFIGRRRTSVAFQKKREKYLPILADLRAELEGAGGNPDLLLNIYGAGD